MNTILKRGAIIMKLKNIIRFIMLICICSVFSIGVFGEEVGQSTGTLEIKTIDDLNKFIESPYYKNVSLDNNIDIKEYNGIESLNLSFEEGVFDGKKNKIKIANLVYDFTEDPKSSGDANPCVNKIGLLFGENKGEVKNLSIEIEKLTIISQNSELPLIIGGICGLNSGTISGCFCYIGEIEVEIKDGQQRGVAGDNEGTNNLCIGGLTGKNTGTIQDCYSEVYIYGENIKGVDKLVFGGIAGIDYYEHGGVAGDSSETSIKNCYVLGEVDLLSDMAGIKDSYIGSILGRPEKTGDLQTDIKECMCFMDKISGDEISDFGLSGLYLYNECEYNEGHAVGGVAASSNRIIKYDEDRCKLELEKTDLLEVLKKYFNQNDAWNLSDLRTNTKYVCYLPQLNTISEDAQRPHAYLMLNKIYVDSEKVTKRNYEDVLYDNKLNAKKVSYSIVDNELQLNGIDFPLDDIRNIDSFIKSSKDLNINLKGKNKIGVTNNMGEDNARTIVCGINVNGALKLKGTGLELGGYVGKSGIIATGDIYIDLSDTLTIMSLENGIECGSDLTNIKGTTDISSCENGVLIEGNLINNSGSIMKIDNSKHGICKKGTLKEKFGVKYEGGKLEIESRDGAIDSDVKDDYNIGICPPSNKQIKVSYGNSRDKLGGDPIYYKVASLFSCLKEDSLNSAGEDEKISTGEVNVSPYKYVCLEEENIENKANGKEEQKEDNKENDNDKTKDKKENKDKSENKKSSGSSDGDGTGDSSETFKGDVGGLESSKGTSNISTGDISDLFLVYILLVSALGVVVMSIKMKKN